MVTRCRADGRPRIHQLSDCTPRWRRTMGARSVASARSARNMTVVEYDGRIVVIDCGVRFPTTEMHGIDLVLPDFGYLLDRRDRIEAIVITHGHEDHLAGLPWVLRELDGAVPVVYGRRLVTRRRAHDDRTAAHTPSPSRIAGSILRLRMIRRCVTSAGVCPSAQRRDATVGRHRSPTVGRPTHLRVHSAPRIIPAMREGDAALSRRDAAARRRLTL